MIEHRYLSVCLVEFSSCACHLLRAVTMNVQRQAVANKRLDPDIMHSFLRFVRAYISIFFKMK